MSDLLLLTEKIRNTLFLGESHFREFKSALEGKPDHKKPRLVKSICADIGEALVSFANADGGSIIIGVEDNGTITGISHSAADIEIMLNAVNSHVYQNQKLPIVHAVSIELDGKNILYFYIYMNTQTEPRRRVREPIRVCGAGRETPPLYKYINHVNYFD